MRKNGCSKKQKERKNPTRTDFLFGINPLDKLHNYVVTIAKLSKERKIYCLVASSAFMEFRTVLYSRGKKPIEVLEALSIIKDFIKSNNIMEIPLKGEHIIAGESLRVRYGELTYFDALHAGVALVEKAMVVSYDDVYSRISELKWKSITEFGATGI